MRRLRRRRPSTPAILRFLVAGALLHPPRDWGGGYGAPRRREYVYGCRECGVEIPPLPERFRSGTEPLCVTDREHGPMTVVRRA